MMDSVLRIGYKEMKFLFRKIKIQIQISEWEKLVSEQRFPGQEFWDREFRAATRHH
jgi:hypothetical protein